MNRKITTEVKTKTMQVKEKKVTVSARGKASSTPSTSRINSAIAVPGRTGKVSETVVKTKTTEDKTKQTQFRNSKTTIATQERLINTTEKTVKTRNVESKPRRNPTSTSRTLPVPVINNINIHIHPPAPSNHQRRHNPKI